MDMEQTFQVFRPDGTLTGTTTVGAILNLKARGLIEERINPVSGLIYFSTTPSRRRGSKGDT